MKIFYIAEITGKVGVWAVKKKIAEIKQCYRPDFIIANADKATGAGGLGKQHAGYLKKMGVDCITGGDCIFQKQDLVDSFLQLPFVLRSCNMPEYSPGKGYRIFTARTGKMLAVISLLGRVGQHRLLADNPFTAIQKILPKIEQETPFIIVDFSATATGEKQAMAFFLAGRVSAVVGSGTGAVTADKRLMSSYEGLWNMPYADVLRSKMSCSTEQKTKKTAYITDAGRTGSFDSVGGYEPTGKIREYRTGLIEYPQETWKSVCVQGLDITLDGAGSAQSMEWVRLDVSDRPCQSLSHL